MSFVTQPFFSSVIANHKAKKIEEAQKADETFDHTPVQGTKPSQLPFTVSWRSA